MKHKVIRVNLYPTPAPATDEVLYDVDVIEEVSFVCEKLFLEHRPLDAYDKNQIRTHFLSLSEIMSFEHHLVLEIEEAELDWAAVLQECALLLPQFAWVRCQSAGKEFGRKIYYIDFVPIALREEGFPFDLAISRSLEQQLGYPLEAAGNRLCRLLEEHLLKCCSPKKVQQIKEPPVQETIHVVPKEAEKRPSTENQLRFYQEEIKREKYGKERLRITNEKLELMMEKLEQAMMYGGLLHLESPEEEDTEWAKRIKISLREYSYLMQKAKYLEQVWKLNGELVIKSERMTVSGNQLIYERDQINRVKDTMSSGEVYMVMDECKLIEARATIRMRPWFQPPFVKLMKMDYDSLLSKSAYFDLLQGESYVLEKLQRTEETVVRFSHKEKEEVRG